MEICELTPDLEDQVCCCFKPYDETFAAGVPRKRAWLRQALDRGLQVWVARSEDGEPAGLIQCGPIELCPHLVGDRIAAILCIWVHGYDRGIGIRQGRGLGKALLEAAETGMRGQGAQGMAAWGLSAPVWMSAAWFEQHGYRRVQDQGYFRVVFKPFVDGAQAPMWIEAHDRPGPIPGKVRVSSFVPGWCTAGNLIHAWAERAAAELGDRVIFETLDTSEPEVLARFGIPDGLLVDGVELPITGEETYEEVKAFIAQRLG